ncbi:hypothetical protein SAMN04488029_1863 [Reichenbachiella faecimaris]|uniref:Uncharacterized protein n=1 Tax=Reichenbachiella faecimaris TaxID=692418 RepID=A0A1W2GBT4_REIFA|nr:hypothetical protein [Reichenbachiella faecimaris]SMD34139.1 hypothetical protein SAMN04488029_1863 [Reichenbachiella faecimaris]
MSKLSIAYDITHFFKKTRNFDLFSTEQKGTMRNFIFTATLIIIANFSYGQDQWLITAKLDTIYGKIMLQAGDPFKADEARVKTGKDKEYYKSYHLRSVHLEDGKDFEVLKIDERYQFAQVDLRGKYFTQYLYLDPSSSNASNYVLKVLVDWKGKQYRVSNLTARKKFAAIFEDCKTVSEKILSGDLKKNQLDKIFAEYDDCIDKINSRIAPAQEILPMSEDIEIFISDLKSKDLYQGDLSMMIDDINQKLMNQQNIPKYLQQAVLEQLGDDEELKSQFLMLVN